MRKKLPQFLLVIIIWLGLFLIPAFAQANDQETIEIDGRQLFEVADYDTFPAEVRANWVNYQIKAVVESGEKPQTTIEIRNKLPIIILNNRYLLTVTRKDTSPINSPREQADIWADKITQAVEKSQKERNESYLTRRLFLAFTLLVLSSVINWLLGKFWQKAIYFCSKIFNLDRSNSESNKNKALTLGLSFSLLLIRISLWLVATIYITNLFPLTRSWSYRIKTRLIESFTISLISIGNNSYSLLDFLFLAVLEITLFIVANVLANFLLKRVLILTQISRGVREAIALVVKYVFIFIGTIVLLQVWGFDLSSLTILASAFGVAIGFGFQDIAKNFGSGLVLLFERPIQVGDFVEVNQYAGIIEYIGPRSTLIKTLDQISIIVPNSRFLESEVINWSHNNPISRLHIPIGVSYDSEVQLVKTALLEASKKCSDVLSFPPPQVLLLGFGDSAINFELLVWMAQPQKQSIIKSELYFAISTSFNNHHIEIPYPQQDINLRSAIFPVPGAVEVKNSHEDQAG
ncbi:small-conductance mechanosensitive channel [Xenococcus sp. PCC 7305]|uniref:mechanosensitive ion channel family protein n=1 Tax=Xenococcus sp. PCC 7305 TaxID=102125 RepID=UPI0002AD13DD|nr:mechanosensitive ion channel domain-containing protein [Xenococcus sp. PCC 7305]ELS00862.1 small-conductance mechanosensitive channel [Xenococcus sp. PCC 7305]